MRFRTLLGLGAAAASLAAVLVGVTATPALANGGPTPLPNPLIAGSYPGGDPEGPVVAVFSNSSMTDPWEEDWDIATALRPMASEVRVTDGGDGSAAVWATVLDGADVLVLPEFPDDWIPGDSAAIGDDALDAIRGWTEAGGLIIGTGSYTHGAIVSELTGIDYTEPFSDRFSHGPWALQLDDPELPDSVPTADFTGGLPQFSQWTDEQRSAVIPVYYNADTDNLAVGAFVIGNGRYVYMAYDWYPDDEDITSGARAAWDATLRFAVGGSFTPRKSLDVSLGVEIGEQVAGAPLSVTAVGLKPGAVWRLEMHSTVVVLGTGTVPVSGTVITTVTLPDDVSAGWHRLTFTSTFGDGSSASWTKWVQVAADGTLLAIADEAPDEETDADPQLAASGSDLSPEFVALALLLLLGGGAMVAGTTIRTRRSSRR